MSKGHEPHHVDAPALHKLGGIFALVFIVILGVMYVLWRHVHPWTLTMPPPVVPPQPRLQSNPPVDRVTQYRLQAQRLESYGWADADHHVAHIPIERAMALLAQEHQAQAGQSDRSTSP